MSTNKRFASVAAAALVGASACLAQPQDVELRLDATTTVAWDGAPDLTLQWVEILDSRCAIGVVCVWEGEVGVELRVAVGKAAALPLTLTRQNDGDERAAATVSGYRLRLERVDPYPVAEAPPARADYVARVLVAPPGSDLPVATAVAARTWGQVKAGEGAGR